MHGGLGYLEWIKSRRSGRGLSRWLRGAMLLAWKAARRLPGARRLRVRVKAGGLRMAIRCFSYDDLLVVSPQYEACIADVLPPPGSVAVDAGAFIGLYTLRYARAVGPEGRVVAVEPQPGNFRMLERNVRLGGYGHVVCERCALGREEGEAWLAHGDETSTASTVRGQGARERVALVPLDVLLGRLGIAEISLLKIDVEGAELDVLEGAAGTLARSPAARLIVEVHAGHESPPSGECPVAAWLTSRGYAIDERRDGERLFYVATQRGAGA